MKDKITDSLKPALLKRPSDVGYWKLNEMPGSTEYLRQKHKFLNFWGKTIWRNNDKRAKSKWERTVSNRWNHIRKRGVAVNGWESRTLNKPTLDFDKQLINLEENIISVYQVPLWLPLFLACSSEVLNSDINSCFDGVVFQNVVCEECFSIRLQCLPFTRSKSLNLTLESPVIHVQYSY